MPDFDLGNGKVKVTITGKILNEDFARILIKNPTLGLKDILLLDKVQKHKPITVDEFCYLKKQKFTEGRKGNVFLVFKVIEPTQDKGLLADYVTNRSFDDQYFKDMIVKYIKKGGKVKRKDIDALIVPKLSAVLTEDQKKNKVINLLSALRMENKVKALPGYFWTIP